MPEQRLGPVLWHGKHLVALAVASSIAVAVLASDLTNPVYEATTLLRVDQSAGANTGSDRYNAQQASQNLAGTYAVMLDSRSFLDRISSRVAGGRYDAAQLQARVSAEAVKDTTLVSLRARAASPAAAEALAGSVARATVAALNADSRSELDGQQREILARISAITSQIERLGADRSPSVHERLLSLRLARNSLTQQLGGVLGESVARTPSVSPAGPPTAPAQPVSPRTALNIGAGVLLGLLVGIGLAWLRARTDTRLRSAQEATDLLDRPLLGTLPSRVRERAVGNRSLRDAFDVVLANLLISPDERRIIMVTSPSSADGKTFVARGLAQVAAQGGRKVLLVDGDLRARALSRSLGRANAPGLSDAVVDAKQGRCEDVDDLAVDIAFDGAAVRFLPAGTETPNPSSLLHRPIVHGLFEALPDAQLVIIDTPPAAALPDALLLATVADQVVVVARARVTRREELSAVVAMLARRLPDKLIGVVVIGPSEHASYPTAPPRGEARAAVAS
jgi:Mrp family chromosome partitioning ATPase